MMLTGKDHFLVKCMDESQKALILRVSFPFLGRFGVRIPGRVGHAFRAVEQWKQVRSYSNLPRKSSLF